MNNSLERRASRTSYSRLKAGIDTLVLVDDDVSMIMAMVDLYETMYGKVMEFSNPVEAKNQILQMKERAVILSDYDMPELTCLN
jgi:FixJ family two-component response regulator